MKTTIVESSSTKKPKPAHTPDVIDISAQETHDGMQRSIRYFFEFDVSDVTHTMKQFDVVELVVATADSSVVYTAKGEVSSITNRVCAIELYLEPVDNPVADVLRQSNQWSINGSSTAINMKYTKNYDSKTGW